MTTASLSLKTHHKRATYVLLAIILASVAAAAVILPQVWNVLAVIDAMPKMHFVQTLLAQAPMASWLMMFLWGGAVTVTLIFTILRHWGVPGALTVALLMFISVTWYVHMPNVNQCSAMYSYDSVCNLIQWSFKLSLAAATAAYMFAVFLLGLSALGLLWSKDD